MRVLITGANGGLGGAVVNAFLEQGDTVFAVARSWRGQAARDGLTCLEADLTTRDGCGFVVKSATPVDSLVHLVGGFAGGFPLEDTSDEVWQDMLNLNLRSTFEMFRAVIPVMRASGHGRLLAIGSRAGVEPGPNVAIYAATKAALVHLVRSVALELKGSGITANTVLPGTIDTPANRSAMPRADFTSWVAPESIARLLVWLASDDARDVNGAVVPIYGRG